MVLNCKITIGNLVFTAVNEVYTKSSWRYFTDTAKIKIPRKLYHYVNGRLTQISQPIQEIIKPDDTVKIELGYNNTLVTEFEGYVARVPRATIPYEIECEDEMHILKQKEVSVHIEDATLRQILEKAAPGYEVDCPDEIYGDFSLDTVTPLEVFRELKTRAGIYVFFRGKRLVAAKMYSDQKVTNTVANYKIGVNIISNDLLYQRPEDVRLKMFFSSQQADGTVVRYEIGTSGGNIQRWNLSYGATENRLKEIAESRYESVKSTGGYEGTIKSFGFPFVVHGQRIRIVDELYEKRDTTHFVDEVEVKFSTTTGYRRILNPSKRA